MVSAESSSVDLGPLPDKAEDPASKDDTKKDSGGSAKLSEVEAAVLCDWLTATLGPTRVRSVKTTSRLSDSPAIVTDHESGALRRMMKMLVRLHCCGIHLTLSFRYFCICHSCFSTTASSPLALVDVPNNALPPLSFCRTSPTLATK
jgi:hypothetical protein